MPENQPTYPHTDLFRRKVTPALEPARKETDFRWRRAIEDQGGYDPLPIGTRVRDMRYPQVEGVRVKLIVARGGRRKGTLPLYFVGSSEDPQRGWVARTKDLEVLVEEGTKE